MFPKDYWPYKNTIVLLQILPHELQLYKGGKELLSEIEVMTSKVSAFRAQQKLEEQNNQKSTENEIQPSTTSEIKGLLSSPSQMKNGGSSSKKMADQPKEQSGLNVQLEAGILSVNDPKFDQRDKSLNTDLEWIIVKIQFIN